MAIFNLCAIRNDTIEEFNAKISRKA